MIAFLHTSDIHIDKFEKLVRKFDQDVEIRHFVNKEILTTALEKGSTDSDTFSDEVAKIKKINPALIICTCSTYGAECDVNDTIERIDLPIASFLVKEYKKIGLAYTAKSTKAISENLLTTQAENLNKEICLINIDCSAAWQYYESDDFEAYSKTIADTILEYQDQVDVIFLAQASMEGAKKFLKEDSKKVYSSPEHGVKHYLMQLHSK